MPAGRPTLYRPEYCERVIELGREGKSPAQIASDLDVARPTLLAWSDQHPEFLTALTRAKVHEQAWWEDKGQAALTSDRFNSAVWSKSMSARFREDYTERKELLGEGGSALIPVLNVTIGTESDPAPEAGDGA